MFRHMCGKSAKRRGAMQAIQDMSTAKRALVHRAYCMKGANLPRQAYSYTQMMTGAQSGAGHKERERKDIRTGRARQASSRSPVT